MGRDETDRQPTGHLAAVRRRYARLGTGEFAAAAVLALVAACGVIPATQTRRDALATWSALVPLLVVLVQAGGYWLLARRWVGVAPMPRRLARAYRAFRVLHPVLLVAGLVGLLVWSSDVGTVAVALGVWLFGVAEYVNYFVRRLAYPVHRWPVMVRRRRTPRLVVDLRDAH